MKPFKVMCIDQPIEWRLFAAFNNLSIPDVTEKCTVIQVVSSRMGKPGYVLQEYNHKVWFAPEFFATLPSTEEEVSIEQEQEAIIYQR